MIIQNNRPALGDILVKRRIITLAEMQSMGAQSEESFPVFPELAGVTDIEKLICYYDWTLYIPDGQGFLASGLTLATVSVTSPNGTFCTIPNVMGGGGNFYSSNNPDMDIHHAPHIENQFDGGIRVSISLSGSFFNLLTRGEVAVQCSYRLINL